MEPPARRSAPRPRWPALPGGWLALLGAGLWIAAPAPAHMARIPEVAREMALELGFEETELHDLLDGGIVWRDLAEGSHKELALAVAMLVPLSPQQVFEELSHGQFFAINRTVLQVGELPPGPVRAADLAGLELPVEEIDALRSAESGTRFNLSRDEITRLRRASGAPAETLLGVYRELLAERARIYLERGATHLPPYDRGSGRAAYPGEDLRTSVQALSHLQSRSPGFFRSIRDFPANPAPDVTHRFFWSVQRIQGRPTAVLSHWAMQLRPHYALVAERQFYVGQAYNALQIAGGAFALEGGRSLVFYTNRTATDQVTGFASGAARALGQRFMRDQVVDLFETIRAAIAQGAPPAS